LRFLALLSKEKGFLLIAKNDRFSANSPTINNSKKEFGAGSRYSRYIV